jgi:hypothetical protein
MASLGDHPETDVQALDDDSDACAQSLDDDSDEDVQQLDDDNDEEHLSRWQANFQTSPQASPQACHPKDKSSTATDAQQQKDDGDDYEPASGFSTTRGHKRVAHNL